MSAINTRPTKRIKRTHSYYLPDVVFRNVLSYIVDPYYADRQAHKERFLPIMFQLTVLPLYLPIYDDDVRRDDSQMVLQHHIEDIENNARNLRKCDIRTLTTRETRETLEFIRWYEVVEGQFYKDPKKMEGRYYKSTFVFAPFL